MNATATKIKENDRPAPALGNEGNGATVGTDIERNYYLNYLENEFERGH